MAQVLAHAGRTGHDVARNTMRLTLAVDRRLANGAPLARFAERVRVLLEAEPDLS